MAAMTPVSTSNKMRSDRRDKFVYTIDKHPNKIYGIRPKNESLKICVVSFNNISHAYLMAGMMEEHKRRTSEWPPLLQEDGNNSFMLPDYNSTVHDMYELSVTKWDKDELSVHCTKNMLDLLILTRITPTKSGYNIGGDSYSFNAPIEFYKDRFDELFELM